MTPRPKVLIKKPPVKNKPEIVFAVESTCDESSLAVFETNKLVFHETISSSELHVKWGGVVPEEASRCHELALPDILSRIPKKYLNPNEIVYASKPGLVGAIHVGKVFAQTIAEVFNVSIIGVDHVLAHALSAGLSYQLKFPLVSVVLSGAHSQIYYFKSPHDFTILVDCEDDAIGEAFDKVGKMLGLSYPAGPLIDASYQKNLVDKNLFKVRNRDKNFSFSGAKSKVRQLLDKNPTFDKNVLASTFQWWAVDEVISRLKTVLKNVSGIEMVLVGGGVSANTLLRDELSNLNIKTYLPELKYCTDNAAMIGNYFVLCKNFGC